MLFRTATWYSGRPRPQASSSAGLEPSNDGEGGEGAKDPESLVAAFCTLADNPALKITAKLLALLGRPAKELDILAFWHGPLSEWPQDWGRAVRKAVLTTVGQLLRKLVDSWQQYPWKLWGLADRRSSPETQLACAQALISAPECCLDAGLSGRLKKSFPSAEALVQEDVKHFLSVLFSRAVLASTFIERRFACFTQWAGAKANYACTPPVLASKHVTCVFKDHVEAWRARAEQPEPHGKRRRSGKYLSRPSWSSEHGASKPMSRKNGYHMFVAEQKERLLAEEGRVLVGEQQATEFLKNCGRSWQQLTREAKDHYAFKARGANAQAKALEESARQAGQARADPPAEAGFWGMTSLSGEWPLDPSLLADFLTENGGFGPVQRTFRQARAHLATDISHTLPFLFLLPGV